MGLVVFFQAGPEFLSSSLLYILRVVKFVVLSWYIRSLYLNFAVFLFLILINVFINIFLYFNVYVVAGHL